MELESYEAEVKSLYARLRDLEGSNQLHDKMKKVGRDKLKAAKTEILNLKENITQLEAGQGLMVSQ